MKGAIIALLTALALATTPTMGNAAPQLPSAAPAAEQGPAVQAESDGPQEPTGLPPRAAPPRTMHAQWPVFGLFAVTWVAIIGYLIATGRRAERLAGELEVWEARR
ncbi:MAG TPA: CcmD family protein [Longimicrobiaceae bacterium]